MENPWKTITKKTVYDNPWISISHRDVITPGNTKGIYGLVHFKNTAIGIIPLDKELNTWIVGQYRYTLEEYSWEIPEGGGPEGSSLLDSAKRELQEETGITATKWTKVLDLNTSNSVTDEIGVTYVAQDLHFGDANPEDCEELEVRKLPFSELVEMVIRGEIRDGLSICSILKVKLMLDRGLLNI